MNKFDVVVIDPDNIAYATEWDGEYESLHALVGGYPEMVRFPLLGLVGYIDEGGERKKLLANGLATELWWGTAELGVPQARWRDQLVGRCVVTAAPDADGDTPGLTLSQRAVVLAALVRTGSFPRE